MPPPTPAMETYVANVRGLTAEMFHLSELDMRKHDKIWEKWTALLMHQESQELWKLLEEDVRDSFKARALAILMAPNLAFPPFSWPSTSGSTTYLDHPDSSRFLQTLSAPLQTFVLRMLPVCMNAARASLSDRNLRRAIGCLTLHMLRALTKLPEDDPMAMTLWESYVLRKREDVRDSDDYQPLFNLMYAPDVPEKWKRLAEARMRELVHAEQDAPVDPRQGSHLTLTAYIRCMLQRPLHSETACGAQLPDRIEFILGLPNLGGLPLFNHWDVGLILTRLKQGDCDVSLAHRFARLVVLGVREDYGPFSAYSPETLAAAEMMLRDFGDKDAELAERLRTIIVEGRKRIRENERAEQEKRAARESEEAVLALMR